MKHLSIILLFISVCAKAQTITPHVINSAGGGGAIGTSSLEVYYNIGETIITTQINGSNTVTQGFLQPDIAGNFALSITPLYQNESCLNKKDGFINLAINSQPSNTYLLFKWTPDTVCPANLNYQCNTIDSLAPGNYSVSILALDNTTGAVKDSVKTTFVITASAEPCNITVYNGFTPDGDGLNDNWIIENIENYANNTVTIFNRWGNKVWSTQNYNNTTNYWDGKGPKSSVLTSGTYFYIIELENGAGVKKGWVELTGK